MKKLVFFLAMVLLIFAGGDKGKKEKVLKEDIVVVAEKTPVALISIANSVENLRGSDLRNFKTTDLKEALFLLPSAYIPEHNTHGIVASSFIRGVSSSRGLFSIEGVPLLDPNTYTLPLDTIPAFFLSSVETVMGPQSSLWGNGAMGFASFLALDSSPSSSLRFLAGGMSTLSLEGKTGFSRGNFSLKTGYSYFNTAGVTENNRYKRNSFYLVSSYSRGNFQIKPFLLYSNQLGYIPFIMRGVPARDRRARDKLLLAALPLKLELSKIRLTLSPFYFKKNYTFTDPNDPWGFTNSSTEVKSRGIFLQGEAPVGKTLQMVAGLTWRRENLASKNNLRINYLNLTPSYMDGWLNLVYQRESIFISLGGGYSWSSGYGGRFLPKISGAFWLSKNLKFRAAYSQGLRFPSPSETTGPWGNPSLNPERSQGYEAGMDILPLRGIMISFTGFNTKLEDLITFDYHIFKFSNIGKAEIKGWEGKFTAIGREWTTILSVLHLSAKDLAANQQLLRRPRWLLKFMGSKTLGPRARFSLSAVYVGKRPDFDDLTWSRVENPGYFLLNLYAEYCLWKGLSLFLKADNIFNKKYQDIFGYPSPGRSLYAGLEFNF